MPPLDEKGFLGKEIEKWIPKIRNAHREFFALADEVNEYCQKAMYKFDAHNKDRQEVLVSSLYIRTLNNYQASNCAFEADAVRQRTVSCHVRASRGSTRCWAEQGSNYEQLLNTQ